ncbi:MAG: hypothetical protein NUV67_06065 [archaeon]|nr:hypothetical protein [archaeon]
MPLEANSQEKIILNMPHFPSLQPLDQFFSELNRVIKKNPNSRLLIARTSYQEKEMEQAFAKVTEAFGFKLVASEPLFYMGEPRGVFQSFKPQARRSILGFLKGLAKRYKFRTGNEP